MHPLNVKHHTIPANAPAQVEFLERIVEALTGMRHSTARDAPLQDAVILSLPRIPADAVIFDHKHRPYLLRIDNVLRHWIQEEWRVITAIEASATEHGWTAAKRTMLAEACLTPANLAHRLDNISLSKLVRELKKLDAPPPGELIRNARLCYARHLLIHSRLLVREIAARCGYDSDRSFSRAFVAFHGKTPLAYRDAHSASSHSAPPRDDTSS